MYIHDARQSHTCGTCLRYIFVTNQNVWSFCPHFVFIKAWYVIDPASEWVFISWSLDLHIWLPSQLTREHTACFYGIWIWKLTLNHYPIRYIFCSWMMRGNAGKMPHPRNCVPVQGFFPPSEIWWPTAGVLCHIQLNIQWSVVRLRPDMP